MNLCKSLYSTFYTGIDVCTPRNNMEDKQNLYNMGMYILYMILLCFVGKQLSMLPVDHILLYTIMYNIHVYEHIHGDTHVLLYCGKFLRSKFFMDGPSTNVCGLIDMFHLL